MENYTENVVHTDWIKIPIPLSVAKNGGAIRLVFKIPFPIEKNKYIITNAVDYLQHKTICYSLLPDEHNMIWP